MSADLFHGFIAVAPLKVSHTNLILFLAGSLFHGFIAVAPLKATDPLTFLGLGPTLPRLHRRGPIEG